MSKQTSILIRRHILSLKPREIFYRADLLRYGTEHVVDQNIYRLRQANKIVRLLKGVYMRRQPDGWLPSPEVISEIRAKMLGRLICEDAETATVKICNPDEELETLSFNTTGRGLSFQYQGKTIRFKETTGKKVLLSESRIGKAVNVLWNLGPDLSIDETRWFLEKYLHSEERHQMRQQLSGLPPWLMERFKLILPDYIAIGYNGYHPESFENSTDQYKNRGNGPSLREFASTHYDARIFQKMKETDEQIVATLFKPIESLTITQKRLLLEQLFKDYWEKRVLSEGSKSNLKLKSNSGFFTKLLSKAAGDPLMELEQVYLDIQSNLIQFRQALSQSLTTAKQLDAQIEKNNEVKVTLLDELSQISSESDRFAIEEKIEEREKAILDLVEQLSDVTAQNVHLRTLSKEIEQSASKSYTLKQMLFARAKAIKAYERSKR